MVLACVVCAKTSDETPIKRCAKCSETPYCSRECQKEDWKAHKKQCGTAKSSSSGGGSSKPAAPGNSSRGAKPGKLSPPKGVDAGVADPFTRLNGNTWLHGRSETDVYRLLLDAYRLRANDDYNMEGDVDADGLLAGNPSALPAFKRFLTKVEGKEPALLPGWWSAEKRTACEAMGMDRGVWQNLMTAVEKSDIIDHYGDGQFPMQLRMFAETALGRGPGGQSGRAMMQMLMAMESGGMGNMVSSTLDMSRR